MGRRKQMYEPLCQSNLSVLPFSFVYKCEPAAGYEAAIIGHWQAQ